MEVTMNIKNTTIIAIGLSLLSFNVVAKNRSATTTLKGGAPKAGPGQGGVVEPVRRSAFPSLLGTSDSQNSGNVKLLRSIEPNLLALALRGENGVIPKEVNNQQWVKAKETTTKDLEAISRAFEKSKNWPEEAVTNLNNWAVDLNKDGISPEEAKKLKEVRERC